MLQSAQSVGEPQFQVQSLQQLSALYLLIWGNQTLPIAVVLKLQFTLPCRIVSGQVGCNWNSYTGHQQRFLALCSTDPQLGLLHGSTWL